MAYGIKGEALSYLIDKAGAIKCYDEAIRLDPTNAEAYNNKGDALAMLGDYAGAIIECDKAISLNPKLEEAYATKGVALSGLGNHATAVIECDKAIALNPRLAKAYVTKGAALFALGKLDEAIKCYDKAIEINPNHTKAHELKVLALQNVDIAQHKQLHKDEITQYTEASDCAAQANLLSSNVGGSGDDPSATEGTQQMKYSKLWQEMIAGNYHIIEEIVGGMEGDELHEKAKAFLETESDGSKLPEILLLGMHLKQNKSPDADEIIKASIIKMASYDINAPKTNKILQEGYKVAIDEILSISSNIQDLLREAVHRLEDDKEHYPYNRTILHEVSYNGHPELVKLLFAGGWKETNIDQLDNFKKTPLYFAVVSKHVEVVRELFSEHKPDIIQEGSVFKPIAVAMLNISLWKDIFTNFADKTLGYNIPLSDALITKISNAHYFSHIDYMELANFCQCVHLDVRDFAGKVLDDM